MPKVLPSRPTLASGSVKESPPSTHVARNNKTWRRTENITSSPYAKSGLSNGQSPKQFGNTQSATSYVRKGRSLVRNPVAGPALSNGPNGFSSTSVYRLNPVNRTEAIQSFGSEKKNSTLKPQNGLKTGPEVGTAPHLKVQTKSLSWVSKSSTSPSHSTEGGGSEATLSNTEILKTKDAPNVAGAFQKEAVAIRVMGTKEDISDDGKSKLSSAKKMIYVKHKSHQLVAARHSESSGPSASLIEKNQAVPCTKTHGQYFKRNKNQLIRNAPLNQSHHRLAHNSRDESLNSEGQGTTNDSYKFSRNMSRVRAEKNLFPWKRMSYWRKNMASCSNRSSSSLINKKLLLSLKRDTVYTRSTGGFSLRRSKVLSIGGSNLKWSKSIEKRIKKVNEEATIAVAEVEKKKREQKVAFAVGRAKIRNQLSRERVFRIGSVRYKMDSSRRTLQRIPDENPSSGLDQQSGRNSRMSFIPKRLLIGNKEYIRIGNGNQLVRDPKTRIRTLASEKIRWSLHSVRLRLARKQQYCQFFTRFGKCNKEDGKCRFIHDPAKIAVCTKFLKGLCNDTNCKLTHKVIPERMQDCSYFLQGLCTNENCPYRHVNVNPDSSVCEGFLRGYCAEGNECRKKHSYVCPQFESTGECPQGKKCKLHHPSRNMKNRKRKRAKENNSKHVRGRYFGSNRFDGEIEFGRIASSGHCSEQKKNGHSSFSEGEIMDYISLEVGESDNEEGGEEAQGNTDDAMDTSTNLCMEADLLSDHLMLPLDDLDGDDDLIKPIAIMNIPIKQPHTLIKE
ncbi:zinc finger CCCH domain-containing protein 7-like [Papaver somniferum]|uniref:zinc finger CCCH domain-containing protein 7-like n=1 Tax=Papaver somniferum TaxID=3469 RepID=UPI000E6FDA72|nr:zinc finger CCCH domain-containing protein 7-like [Papaver somniferum]